MTDAFHTPNVAAGPQDPGHVSSGGTMADHLVVGIASADTLAQPGIVDPGLAGDAGSGGASVMLTGPSSRRRAPPQRGERRRCQSAPERCRVRLNRRGTGRRPSERGHFDPAERPAEPCPTEPRRCQSQRCPPPDQGGGIERRFAAGSSYHQRYVRQRQRGGQRLSLQQRFHRRRYRRYRIPKRHHHRRTNPGALLDKFGHGRSDVQR